MPKKKKNNRNIVKHISKNGRKENTNLPWHNNTMTGWISSGHVNEYYQK